ncbi:MAG: class I SAM-dependent methyltransferase [Candidatus Omnitrophota bacterium]
MSKLKQHILFKLISIVLIQSFFCLDISWAAGGNLKGLNAQLAVPLEIGSRGLSNTLRNILLVREVLFERIHGLKDKYESFRKGELSEEEIAALREMFYRIRKKQFLSLGTLRKVLGERSCFRNSYRRALIMSFPELMLRTEGFQKGRIEFVRAKATANLAELLKEQGEQVDFSDPANFIPWLVQHRTRLGYKSLSQLMHLLSELGKIPKNKVGVLQRVYAGPADYAWKNREMIERELRESWKKLSRAERLSDKVTKNVKREINTDKFTTSMADGKKKPVSRAYLHKIWRQAMLLYGAEIIEDLVTAEKETIVAQKEAAENQRVERGLGELPLERVQGTINLLKALLENPLEKLEDLLRKIGQRPLTDEEIDVLKKLEDFRKDIENYLSNLEGKDAERDRANFIALFGFDDGRVKSLRQVGDVVGENFRLSPQGTSDILKRLLEELRNLPLTKEIVIILQIPEKSRGGRWPWLQRWYDRIGQDWVGQDLAPAVVESGGFVGLWSFAVIKAFGLPYEIGLPLLIIAGFQFCWQALHLRSALEKQLFVISVLTVVITVPILCIANPVNGGVIQTIQTGAGMIVLFTVPHAVVSSLWKRRKKLILWAKQQRTKRHYYRIVGTQARSEPTEMSTPVKTRWQSLLKTIQTPRIVQETPEQEINRLLRHRDTFENGLNKLSEHLDDLEKRGKEIEELNLIFYFRGTISYDYMVNTLGFSAEEVLYFKEALKRVLEQVVRIGHLHQDRCNEVISQFDAPIAEAMRKRIDAKFRLNTDLHLYRNIARLIFRALVTGWLLIFPVKDIIAVLCAPLIATGYIILIIFIGIPYICCRAYQILYSQWLIKIEINSTDELCSMINEILPQLKNEIKNLNPVQIQLLRVLAYPDEDIARILEWEEGGPIQEEDLQSEIEALKEYLALDSPIRIVLEAIRSRQVPFIAFNARRLPVIAALTRRPLTQEEEKVLKAAAMGEEISFHERGTLDSLKRRWWVDTDTQAVLLWLYLQVNREELLAQTTQDTGGSLTVLLRRIYKRVKPRKDEIIFQEGKDVLDIGTRKGNFLSNLKKANPRIGRLVGIDIEEIGDREEGIEFVRMDEKMLAFADGSFDAVTINNIATELPPCIQFLGEKDEEGTQEREDVENLLSEIYRVLRDQGEIYITIELPPKSVEYKYLNRIVQKTELWRIYEQKGVRAFLTEAGFVDIRIEKIPRYWPDSREGTVRAKTLVRARKQILDEESDANEEPDASTGTNDASSASVQQCSASSSILDVIEGIGSQHPEIVSGEISDGIRTKIQTGEPVKIILDVGSGLGGYLLNRAAIASEQGEDVLLIGVEWHPDKFNYFSKVIENERFSNILILNMSLQDLPQEFKFDEIVMLAPDLRNILSKAIGEKIGELLNEGGIVSVVTNLADRVTLEALTSRYHEPAMKILEGFGAKGLNEETVEVVDLNNPPDYLPPMEGTYFTEANIGLVTLIVYKKPSPQKRAQALEEKGILAAQVTTANTLSALLIERVLEVERAI